MFIAEPPRTPWDLNFQVLGFPVRVHPLFWLVGLLLGFGGLSEKNAGIELAIWFVALFASILVHELGHALMFRRFGQDAYIVLYAMGGLAVAGRPRDAGYGSPWSFDAYVPWQPPRQKSPAEQILISAAGPGIQFLLLGLIVAGIYASGGYVSLFGEPLPVLVPHLPGELGGNLNLKLLLFRFLEINLYWPLINLLPVLPLDGGQIAMQVLSLQDPWSGPQRALWLSVIVGGGMAVFALLATQQIFTAMLFGSLALSSYMALQQHGGGRRPW